MFKEIELNKIIKAEWNYKEDNEELRSKLKSNIIRNGFIESVIVRELEEDSYEMVNGNHRLDVLNELNYDKVMCYNLGNITENQAKRIAIETNETRFKSDKNKLVDIISELQKEFDTDELLETMPYSSEQLNNLDSLIDGFSIDQYSNDANQIEDNEASREQGKKYPHDEGWVSIKELFDSLGMKQVPESLAESITTLAQDVRKEKELSDRNMHLIFDYLNALHIQNKQTGY